MLEEHKNNNLFIQKQLFENFFLQKFDKPTTLDE